MELKYRQTRIHRGASITGGCNALQPFENFGTIDALTSNTGTITNNAGAAINNLAGNGTYNYIYLDYNSKINNLAGATLNVVSGVSSATMTNLATINNSGSLNILGTPTAGASFNNYVWLNNRSGGVITINSYGVLSNERTFFGLAGSTDNKGGIYNSGTFGSLGLSFLNDVSGTFETSGKFVSGTTENRGSIRNTGFTRNEGVLTNSGTVVNSGAIYNRAYSVTNNNGLISNSGDFFLASHDFLPGPGASLTGVGQYKQTAGRTIVETTMVQGAVQIDGGVLLGNGILQAPVTVNGGTLSADNGYAYLTTTGGVNVSNQSPAILTIDGSLSFNAGTTQTDINGTGVGQFDVLNITGPASFSSGSFVFSFHGYAPVLGDSWLFMTASNGLSGWENLGVDVRGLTGFDFGLSYTGSGLLLTALSVPEGSSAGGVSPSTPIPEPTTYAMVLTGLCFLGVMARRRKPKTA